MTSTSEASGRAELSKKAQLGQFMTTNNEYIFQGMTLPNFKGKFIEPFAGNGDLVEFLVSRKITRDRIDCYDIEPKHDYIQLRDSLANPFDYSDYYVITNPPYLARNKSKDKTIFDQYSLNDLYKCFLKQLVNFPPKGGMIIIPLNFWSSIRSMDVDLRKEFLKVFNINRLNIFEESVFSDTSYTICSFQFSRKDTEIIFSKKDMTYTIENQNRDSNLVKAWFLPSGSQHDFVLSIENQYTFGGEIYTLPVNSDVKITRLTRLNEKDSKEFTTGIVVKCIDDGMNESQWIRLFYTEESNEINKHTDLTKDLTFRSYAVLVIEPALSKENQKKLVNRFNEFLNEKRRATRSLFLTNYRDKYRKRISFDLVYRIVGYLLSL
jgi:hypothetical protein